MQEMSGGTGEGAALRQQVIAGLDRTIWQPAAGVSALDRVEAVQLLGQFRDPLAAEALLRVLQDGTQTIDPPPLGRWLRDTALDTLLRSPVQPRAATDRMLASYYGFGGRLVRGRLERNVIYDDIPLLVRQGRGGLVLRAYVLPLIGVLLALVVLAELLVAAAGPLAGSNALRVLAGLAFFIGLGLGLFNLHQLGLVLLVAQMRGRLPLPHVAGLRRQALLAGGLAVTTGVLLLYVLYEGLRLTTGFNQARLQAVSQWMLLLPLLVLPCYMLAHDLEAGARDDMRAANTRLVYLAVVLRWVSGLMYVSYAVVAFLLVMLPSLRQGAAGGDFEVLLGTLPYMLYLAVAPLPVLGFLGGLGWLTGGPRRRPPATVEAAR
ncbi:MAG TPA: hypothetical protein VM536_01640 [Chloroflexia bacterium]|nr:hypothetical protein [Chloroflexia bacterium]